MYKRSYRAVLTALLLALISAGSLHAVGEARMQGTVVDDATGKPIAGAKIVVTSPEFKFKQERKSDAKGKFSMMFVDGTAAYEAMVEAEGYRPAKQPINLTPGVVNPVTIPLEPLPQGGTAATQPGEEGQPQELTGTNKAILAYNEGVTALNAKDYTTAMAKFDEARGLDPALAAVADGYAAVASGLLAERQYQPGLAAVDRFLEAKPGDVSGLRLRYDLLKGAGDPKAAAALELLTQADPGRESAIRYFNLAAEAVRGGKTEDAIPLLKRAMEIDPSLDQAYTALAGIYLPRKNYKEALALGEKLKAQKPGSAEALTIQYQAYQGLGDKAKTAEVKAAMDAANSTQTPESAFNQGVTLYNANNTAEAIKAFERVLAAKPDHAKAHYMLGLSYVASNDMAKAKGHLEKFVQLAPNDPDAAAAKEMLATL